MSFGISVKGGTNAGSRRVKERPPWFCRCVVADDPAQLVQQPGHRYSCSCCGTRRPS